MRCAACLVWLLGACGGRSAASEPAPGQEIAIEWRVSQELWGREVLTVDVRGQVRYHFESARGKPSIDRHRRLSAADLAAVREATSDAAFCALRSARPGIDDEGRPKLKVMDGGRTCTVTLWDGEWEGRAEARPAFLAIKAVIDGKPVPRRGERKPSLWPQRVGVYKNGRKVLTVSDEPGPLISTALPPPGTTPPTSKFLSGHAHDPMEENALREILESSTSFDDFISRLKAAGYTLESE